MLTAIGLGVAVIAAGLAAWRWRSAVAERDELRSELKLEQARIDELARITAETLVLNAHKDAIIQTLKEELSGEELFDVVFDSQRLFGGGGTDPSGSGGDGTPSGSALN